MQTLKAIIIDDQRTENSKPKSDGKAKVNLIKENSKIPIN